MSHRFEFSKSWGISLELALFEEGPSLLLQFIYGKFYIPLPFKMRWRWGSECLLPTWGFHWAWSGYRGDLFLYWGKRCRIIYMPWQWEHVRWDVFLKDGTWHRMGKREWKHPENAWQLDEPYTYKLKSGKVQQTTATLGIEEREWRWRWFTWLPWPRMIHRSIDVQFADEVGEKAGSWKGGCVGCGYDMRPGETARMTLRRMERERVFD